MSTRQRPVYYVEQRYRLIEELIARYGLTMDIGVSRWSEQERSDPLRGYVLIQAIHPLEQRSQDESRDQVVRLKMEEWWFRGEADGAEQIQGNTLIECHYTGVAGVGPMPRAIRYCYAPDHHPEEPMHWHPPHDPDSLLRTRSALRATRSLALSNLSLRKRSQGTSDSPERQ